MAKDFAPKFRAKRGRKKARPHFGLWFFTLFLIGSFVFGLVYIRTHRVLTTISAPTKKYKKPEVVTVAPEVVNKNNSKKTTANNESITPQFDFYKILPQERVTTNTQHGMKYLLQLEPLDKSAAVDHLKALLALNGFDPTVKELTSQNGQKNYQIAVGPYDTKEEALTDQKRLHELKIASTLGATK